jgi:hypothetical protein
LGGGTPGADPWAQDHLLRGDGPPRGRFAKGWHLIGLAWRELLSGNRTLLVLPALSALAVAVTAAAIWVPIVYLDATSDHPHLRLAILVATALTAIPSTFVTVFCNVGFLAMVQQHLRGEQPSVRGGVRFAKDRWRKIVAWSLLSSLVGSILRGLEQLPGGGELAGRLLSLAGGLAWSAGTYFVIPVLVMEDLGVKGSIARSASVFRNRWGEAITGSLSIGIVVGLTLPPLMLLVCIGCIALFLGEIAIGVVCVVLGASTFTAALAFASALTELFQLLLYREATEETATPGPFDSTTLASAFQPRRRWWRREATG